MTASRTGPSERDRALAHLASFTRRILPGIIRRIGCWKGISAATLRELRADIHQELTIDCLQHPRLVATSRRAERHARWIRLTERWIYHQYVRPARRGALDPDGVAAPARRHGGEHVSEAPPTRLVCLKNGRCNLQASARKNGSNVRVVRRQLDRLADHFGNDDASIWFWQRRLAEALTGLGADLLRQHATLCTMPANLAAPDPEGRLRRIRRIARRLPVHRTPLEVRKVLARWTRTPNLDVQGARLALEHATALSPDRSEAWLWLFEVTFAAGDLGAAIAALRHGRQSERRRCSRNVLARARLLEARGRYDAAVCLLQRARRRRPLDARVRRACQTLTA